MGKEIYVCLKRIGYWGNKIVVMYLFTVKCNTFEVLQLPKVYSFLPELGGKRVVATATPVTLIVCHITLGC